MNYPILIFSMIYFKRMHIVGKIFAALHLIVMVLFYLSIGTNIDVFHVFLLLEIAPCLETFQSWHEGKITKRKAVRLIALILVGFLVVGGYFTWMMISRGGINSYDQPGYNVSGTYLRDNVGKKNQDVKSSILMKFWISFSA